MILIVVGGPIVYNECLRNLTGYIDYNRYPQMWSIRILKEPKASGQEIKILWSYGAMFFNHELLYWHTRFWLAKKVGLRRLRIRALTGPTS